MLKEKEIIRLLHQGISQRSICKMIKTSDRKIRQTMNKLNELNLTYDDVKNMDDQLFLELFKEKRKEVRSSHNQPDCEYIHKELKRKGVTLMILWEEYVEHSISLNKTYLKYTQFCNVYKKYVETNQLAMHIEHKPGEKCEVDWMGTTIPIYDISLNNIVDKAYIFVGVLPFSQYMFAQATLDMKEESWINHHIDMFNYFGGVPLMCICDNCKTAIISHKKYEEIIFNSAYYEMAEYYNMAIIPARVRSPRDKNSAEGSVGYLTNQIVGKLRNMRFSSINELNNCIFDELKKLNNKDFQKRQYSRTYVFETEEKDHLIQLPDTPYEYALWKGATVSYNYHVQFERNYYSAPHQYVKQRVSLRITRNMIEIYSHHVRIASHPRILIGVNKYVTSKSHMPDNHQAYGEWNKQRIMNWAKTIGPHTYEVICQIFSNARIEQQVYNQCLTILKLKDKYSIKMLELASEIILSKHITPIHRNFKTVLDNMQDEKNMQEQENNYALLRGGDYFGGKRND